MPIRNSKVESDEVFTIHRKARLKGYQRPTASGPVEQQAREDETGSRKESPPAPERPDETGEVKQATRVQSLEEIPKAQTTEDQTIGEPPAPVDPEASVSRQPKAVTPKKTPSGDASKIRLNMNLAYPAAGACPTFDHIARVEGEQVAFRLVMGKALEAYAAMARSEGVEEAPTSYAESSAVAITSRMFPKDAYEKLVASLNPTGLISQRLMGNMIGRRALAAFVAGDNKSA